MKKRFLLIMMVFTLVFMTTSCTSSKINNEITNKITNEVVKYEDITITDFENAVEKTAEKVEHSIVGIAIKAISTTGSSAISEDYAVFGSGIIYKAVENLDNGIVTGFTYYVVTNRHLIVNEEIEKAKVYIFLGYEDVEIEATIVGYDTKVDIACLTFVHTKFIQPAEFGDSDAIKKGSFILAVGNPDGFDYYGSVTMGIVSSPLRYLASDTDDDGVQDFYGQYIQHDAAINAGNSGGGLFTIDGKLVGMNTLKIVGSDVESMCFAIPSNEMKTILDNYLEKGLPIIRPRLGISSYAVRELTPAVIEAQKLQSIPDIYEPNERQYGLYVSEITEGGSIADTAIKTGDIILTFDGEKIKTFAGFSAQINSLDNYQVGDVVEVTYYSRASGSIETISLTLKTSR